jgi:holo-[acyl-carrier protein] synthase
VVIGIGTDMIEIDRVLKACEKKAFIDRYYTTKEIELIALDKKKAADNFAVKEAVVKTFGTGFRDIKPIEIEVLRDDLGKPYINIYGKALGYAKRLKIETLHVSITNTKKYANAFVVGESEVICNF